MKSFRIVRGTPLLWIALSIAVAPASAFAGIPILYEETNAPQPSIADRVPVEACITAFVAKIWPMRNTPVRVALPVRYRPVFSKLDALDRSAATVMRVTMIAATAAEKTAAMNPVCTVSRTGTVLAWSSTDGDAAKTARFGAGDGGFALVLR
jgi:hypothetical protein